MAYTKTAWINDQAPAINATNLNNIENGISANDTAIGDISTLDTTATNLVDAVNEVKGDIPEVSDIYSTSTTDAYSANFINGEIGKFGKTLWTGSFTSGSITVPGLSDYACIGVVVGGVLCIGNKNYGGNNYGTYGSRSIGQMAYRINTSGDNVDINQYDTGGTNGASQQPITAIYGIF